MCAFRRLTGEPDPHAVAFLGYLVKPSGPQEPVALRSGGYTHHTAVRSWLGGLPTGISRALHLWLGRKFRKLDMQNSRQSCSELQPTHGEHIYIALLVGF
jgi:hypothetical protein